ALAEVIGHVRGVTPRAAVAGDEYETSVLPAGVDGVGHAANRRLVAALDLLVQAAEVRGKVERGAEHVFGADGVRSDCGDSSDCRSSASLQKAAKPSLRHLRSVLEFPIALAVEIEEPLRAGRNEVCVAARVGVLLP